MDGIGFDRIMTTLDAAKHLARNGGEYWMGRDIQPILGYDKWDNFKNVIEKAKEACKSAGVEIKYHFLDTGKLITAGKGAQLQREDMYGPLESVKKEKGSRTIVYSLTTLGILNEKSQD